MTIDELCSLVWWTVSKRAQKQSDLDSFKQKLWQPPIGNTQPVPEQSPWSAQSEAKGFQALTAQLGLGQKGVDAVRSSSDPLAPR